MRLSADTSDAIKLVSLWCSVLVCLNHTYTLDVPYAAVAEQPYAFATFFIQDLVKHGVVRISTPFFFLVAAYLLFAGLVRHEGRVAMAVPLSTGYRGEVAKRVHSLAVPFILWAAWSFALLVGLQQLPQLRAMFTTPLLSEPLGVIVERLLWNPVAHPLWFLRDLFLLTLVWPLAWLLLRRRWLGLAVIAALCVPWFVWWEVRETRAVVFFALGAWLAIHRPAIPQPASWGLIASGLVWMSGAALHALHVVRTGATDPVYNNLTIIAGLVTVWFGTRRLLPWLRRPWLLRLSTYTFFIYVAHEPIATFARKAVMLALGTDPLMRFTAWIVAGTITFTVCLAMAFVLRRWLPSMHARLTGGRGGRRSEADDGTRLRTWVSPGGWTRSSDTTSSRAGS